ncbi:ATP-binding cassette domain-containing protein [Dethiothermospora halolimnae]|uniref:ATP-binding cassette domain-containing protein n=1 Tax=Dethiothermospora halolimnae TaxID=3114390 RepID=UPI003CCC1351
MERGDAASDQIESTNCRLNYTQNTVGGVLGFLNVSLQIMSEILIVLLAFAGRIKLAVLAGGTNLISGVSNGFSNIARFRLSIAASKPYFMKINVQDNSIIQKDTPDSKLIKEAIIVKNVCLHYGTKAVLKNVNIGFKKGGKYALIGPSGCGKTTLLKLLLGWLPDYSGTIKFDDVNAKDYTIEQIQKQISYIDQDVFLFNTTIKENITLGEEFPKDKLEKAIKDSALVNDLRNMPEGLETFVGEGTSSLDQENADIVEQSLLMNQELTLILVSHHLSLERRNQFDQVYELPTLNNIV